MIDIVRCYRDKYVISYVEELGFSDVLCPKSIKIKEGDTDERNRKVVSDKQNDILMNPEIRSIKDNLHFRNSGLNQVIAKLAAKNDVAIGFGFSFVLKAKGVERSRILGRMMQNVRICRKAKAKMVVCSYANNVREMRGAKDLQAFARVIGMTGGEAKKALNWKRREKKVVVFE